MISTSELTKVSTRRPLNTDLVASVSKISDAGKPTQPKPTVLDEIRHYAPEFEGVNTLHHDVHATFCILLSTPKRRFAARSTSAV